MMMQAVILTDPSQVGAARRVAAAMARSLGFGEGDVERVALVATELGTNIVRHGGGGELLAGTYEYRTAAGIELIALDRGRGMENVGACMRDGFSTAGSAGTGLGAIARLSTVLDIWSRPGAGTAVLARIRPASAESSPPAGVVWGALLLPKAGEEACGDGWSAAVVSDRPVFMVVDGIGHGPLAADASARAVRLFQGHVGRTPAAILDAVHLGLAGTRGAAGAVARIDLSRHVLIFAGVGNISASVVGDGSVRRAVSHNGILGGSVRKIQEFTYPIAPRFLLVMHSDGLGGGWSLDDYPGLSERHPSLIAGVLCRDFRRSRDDATVLVVKGQAR